MPFSTAAPVTAAPITGVSPATALPYQSPTAVKHAIVPPGNLVATQFSATQIDLTWSDFSWNENGFVLERGTDGVTFGTEIAIEADEISDSDTGLSNGTTYYYRIRAYQIGAPSDLSATATSAPGYYAQSTVKYYRVKGLKNGVYSTYSNIAHATVTDTTGNFDLAWIDNSGGIASFEIESSDNGTSGWGLIASIPAGQPTTATDQGGN